MVALSETFQPPLLKGIKVYPQEPLRFDFILDKGDLNVPDQDLKNESSRLIKYFLASLTVPEKDMWVNLSPYEKDRIVPVAFGRTEMGRDLLAQDYMLKQITASLLYPEGDTGKAFWQKVYAEAQKRFGTTDIPVDTFNKVWIVPEKATVYENKGAAFVLKSRLKVMLESDYLAESKEDGAESQKQNRINENLERNSDNSLYPSMLSAPSSMLARQILKEIVLPILEKEVNEGAHFSSLRQIFHSLILATWYKRKIRASILSRVYVDREKTAGVDISGKGEAEKIWQRYAESFRKGAYNLIKEEPDPVTGDIIPRKYLSGGFHFAHIAWDKADASQLPAGRRESVLSVTLGMVRAVVPARAVLQYAANRHPLSRHVFSQNTFDAVRVLLRRPGIFLEFSRMNRLLTEKPFTDEARLYILTSWLWDVSWLGRQGKPYLKASEVRGWLENEMAVELLERLTSVKHLENERKQPFGVLWTAKYFSSLSVVKQHAYMEFMRHGPGLTIPFDSETPLFNRRFFFLYADVQDSDAERFLSHAYLMAAYYFYRQHSKLRDEYVPPELRDVFGAVSRLKKELPAVKSIFLASASAKDIMRGFMGELKAALPRTYELASLPGRRWSVEDLFGFINSDNFSVFTTFDYTGFPAGRFSFLRAYDGQPLTILHGTGRSGQIIGSGRLTSLGVEHVFKSPRNEKYVFFGSPYNHLSRTPQHFLMGDERMYGDAVFEFPFSVLHPDSRALLSLRGNIFSHFFSRERLDKKRLPVPEDIVQMGEYPLPVSQATRIYYATEKEKRVIQSALEEKGLNIPLLSQEAAPEAFRQMHDESLAVLDRFIDAHQPFMLALAQLRNGLEERLKTYARESLGTHELPELISSYLHEYAVLTFSEIEAGINGFDQAMATEHRAPGTFKDLLIGSTGLDPAGDILFVAKEDGADLGIERQGGSVVKSMDYHMEALTREEIIDLLGFPDVKKMLERIRQVDKWADFEVVLNGIAKDFTSHVVADWPFSVHEVSFSSPVIEGGLPNSATVFARYFLPRQSVGSKVPGVVISSFYDQDVFSRLLSLYLAGQGVAVLEVGLPAYGKRSIQGTRRTNATAVYMALGLDADKLKGFIAQAVADTMVATRWLAGREEVDATRVSIAGQSMAGTIALNTYLLDPVSRDVFSLAPVVNYSNLLWSEGDLYAPVRQRLGSMGVGKDRFDKLMDGFNLDQVVRSEALAGNDRVYLGVIRDDEKVPWADSQALIASLGSPEHVTIGQGIPGVSAHASGSTSIAVTGGFFKQILDVMTGRPDRAMMNASNYYLSVFTDPGLLAAVQKAGPLVRSFIERGRQGKGSVPQVQDIQRFVQGDKELLASIGHRKIEAYYIPDLLLLNSLPLDPRSREAVKWFDLIIKATGTGLDDQIRALRSQPDNLMQLLVFKWLANTAQLKAAGYDLQRMQAQRALTRFIDMFFKEFNGKKVLDSFADLVRRRILEVSQARQFSKEEVLVVPVLTSGEQLGQYVERRIRDMDIAVKPLILTTAMTVEFGREGTGFHKGNMFTDKGKAIALRYLQQEGILNGKVRHIIFLDTGKTGQFGKLLNSVLAEQDIRSDLLLIDHGDFEIPGIEKEWAYGLNEEPDWQGRAEELSWVSIMLDNVFEHSIELPFYKVTYGPDERVQVDVVPTPRSWMAGLVSEAVNQWARVNSLDFAMDTQGDSAGRTLQTNEYSFQNARRTVAEALADEDATQRMLEKILKPLLFHIRAPENMLAQEEKVRPVIERTEQGAVITFMTPLRELVVAVDEKAGIVRFSSLIRLDLLEPDTAGGGFLPFDPVNWVMSEYPFYVWKSGYFVTQFIAQWLQADMASERNIIDGKPVDVVLEGALTSVAGAGTILQLNIPADKVHAPERYARAADRTIFAVIRNRRPGLGTVTELVPASWDKTGLKVPVVGFQGEVSLQEVLSFDGREPLVWKLDYGAAPVVRSEGFTGEEPEGMNAVPRLFSPDDPLVNKVVAAPMIRGSSLSERVFRYRLGLHGAFTEMVYMGFLHLMEGETLSDVIGNYVWLETFHRMKRSDLENNTVLQVVGPHFTNGRERLEAVFGTRERTVDTYVKLAYLARRMGFPELNINMCCPAPNLRYARGGAFMMEDEALVRDVVKGIKASVPGLKISAKVLLPSVDGELAAPDEARAVRIAAVLAEAGIDRLLVQAQTRAFGRVYPEVVKSMSAAVSIPVTYNGSVAAFREDGMGEIGAGDGSYSVEGLMETFEGTGVDQYMVGRLLLGSPWLLSGRKIPDQEIVQMALGQARYLASDFKGIGEAGLGIAKLALLGYVRFLERRDLREMLDSGIMQAGSTEGLIALLERTNDAAMSGPAEMTMAGPGAAIVLLGAGGHVKQTGARRLALFLNATGIPARLMDNSKKKFGSKFYDYYGAMDETVDELVSVNPPFIGVSLLSHDLGYYVRLLDRLNRRHPGFIDRTTFVFGGPAVTNDPDFVFEIMKKVGLKNIIVSPGRGEGKLDEILRHRGEGLLGFVQGLPKVVAQINGVFVNTMALEDNVERPRYISLANYFDDAPVAGTVQDLILPDTNEYRAPAEFIWLELACQGSCTFCSYSVSSFAQYIRSTKITAREYGPVIDDLTRFVVQSYNRGVHRILITSDDIFGDPEFLKQLITRLKAIHDQIPDMTFWATGRPSQIVNRIDMSLLKMMQEVGFFEITLGTESFHESFLRDMGKPSTAELNRKAVRKLYEAGIRPRTTLLSFYPSVTREYLINDLEAVAELYETDDIYIAFHPVLIAIQNTAVFHEFSDEIEYETVELMNGASVQIPQYIRPRDPEMRRVQTVLMDEFKTIREAISAIEPRIHMDRNIDSLIMMTILSRELGRKDLYEKYHRFLDEFCALYPAPYGEQLQSLMQEKIRWASIDSPALRAASLKAHSSQDPAMAGAIYPEDEYTSLLMRNSMRPRKGAEVLVLGTGGGRDAITAIERGAASVVATDIDPEAVRAARAAVEAAGMSDRITVVLADLFDLPPEMKGRTFDHIYMNMPSAYDRSGDPMVSDPGFSLAKRILAGAGGLLKPRGTLEVTNAETPEFLKLVYDFGWEPAVIKGLDLSRQFHRGLMDYPYFVLVPFQDKERRGQVLKQLQDDWTEVEKVFKAMGTVAVSLHGLQQIAQQRFSGDRSLNDLLLVKAIMTMGYQQQVEVEDVRIGIPAYADPAMAAEAELLLAMQAEGAMPNIAFPSREAVIDVLTQIREGDAINDDQLEILVKQVVAENRRWLMDNPDREWFWKPNLLKWPKDFGPLAHFRTDLRLAGKELRQMCTYARDHVMDLLYSLGGGQIEAFELSASRHFSYSPGHYGVMVRRKGGGKIFLIDTTFRQFLNVGNPVENQIGNYLKEHSPGLLESLLRDGFIVLTAGALARYGNAFRGMPVGNMSPERLLSRLEPKAPQHFDKRRYGKFFAEQGILPEFRSANLILSASAAREKDRAEKPSGPGGIDLTPDRLQLSTVSSGAPQDESGFSRNYFEGWEEFDDVQGFVPVGIDIHPLSSSLPDFLGAVETLPQPAAVH
jgi:tRNA-dihydrouridine synthase/radical SAM superfamily enzyme YgiQ (UPF0313 family)